MPPSARRRSSARGCPPEPHQADARRSPGRSAWGRGSGFRYLSPAVHRGRKVSL